MRGNYVKKNSACEINFDFRTARALKQNSQSRTAAVLEVERAKILLKYADGDSISNIESALTVSRPTIYKCIDKALAMGVATALKDKYHSPKARVITDAAKTWIVNLACTKPKDHGYAAEIWSHRLLAQHARRHAPHAGHPCLGNAAKAIVKFLRFILAPLVFLISCPDVPCTKTFLNLSPFINDLFIRDPIRNSIKD